MGTKYTVRYMSGELCITEYRTNSFFAAYYTLWFYKPDDINYHWIVFEVRP